MQNRGKILISALRSAAKRLESKGTRYQWGHMGQCNVGHLLQSLMGVEDFEIVRYVNFEMEEWSEFANDYCDTSKQNVDDIFNNLEKFGFDRKDVIHLENLSDRKVLENLPGGFRYLHRNQREDVIEYFRSLADILAKAA